MSPRLLAPAATASSKGLLRSRTPPPPPILTGLTSSSSASDKYALASPSPRSLRRSSGRLSRRRLLIVILALGVSWLVWSYTGLYDLLLLARFKYQHNSYDNGRITACGLRKQPLLFVQGDGDVAIVWESNCDIDIKFEWTPTQAASTPSYWRKGKTTEGTIWTEEIVKRVTIKKGYHAHQVHLHQLSSSASTLYTYRISSSQVARNKPLAIHTFSFPTSSRATKTSTLNFSILADNQFNLRVFHRLLRRMLSSEPHPSLIIHAGDQVQNPHNLQQWATDFWSPVTSFLPGGYALGQRTPIILARGNHDWDETGLNIYTGGTPPRTDWKSSLSKNMDSKGTYFAYSPHERMRIVVLDSNLDKEMEVEQEQERWLKSEVRKKEWKDASLKIVVVHVAPFLEYWDQETWTKAGESQWSIYVRHRLFPILAENGVTLIISGHSHSYSRGFLPNTLAQAFSRASNSSSLPSLAKAIAKERGWEKMKSNETGESEQGVICAVVGGAGGTLDEDKVEEWGFYEKSIPGKYHFVRMKVSFDLDEQSIEDHQRKRREGHRTYRRRGGSSRPSKTIDLLQWEAVGIDGKVLDRFTIEVA